MHLSPGCTLVKQALSSELESDNADFSALLCDSFQVRSSSIPPYGLTHCAFPPAIITKKFKRR